jgi:hypothetical protein
MSIENKNDRTLGIFDREIRKLFDLSLKILDDKGSIKSSKQVQALRSLQRYIAVYGATKPDNHFQFFQNFFKLNKINLLNILNDDKFLLEGNLVVQYRIEDSNDQELIKRAQKRKIPVSLIYKISCQTRKKIEESLKGLPISTGLVEFELLQPDFFLLHLYRCLRETTSDLVDRSELSRIIGVLESELGENNQSSSPKNPLENITGLAKNLFENLGINLPQNIQIPTQDEMNSTLESVFGNNEFSKKISSQLGDILTSKSLGEGLTKAFTKFQDPSFMNEMTEIVTKTISPETISVLTKSVENLNGSSNTEQITNVLQTLTNSSNLGKLLNLDSETLPALQSSLSPLLNQLKLDDPSKQLQITNEDYSNNVDPNKNEITPD